MVEQGVPVNATTTTAPSSNSTEAAQQAAQTAAQNGQAAGEMFGFLPGGPLGILLIIAAAAGVAIIFAIVVLAFRGRGEKEFEKTSLVEIVKPAMTDVLHDWGKSNGSVLRRDLSTVGEVHKAVRFSESGKLDAQRRSGKVRGKQNLATYQVDEAELNALVEAGTIDSDEAEMMVDGDQVPHRFLSIRPAGRLGTAFWFVTDFLLGLDIMTKYMLVPEHKIRDNGADNSIVIDRSMQMRRFAGINLPLYFESFNVLHGVVMRELYETSLEDQGNYHDKINFFDSQFSQRIQKLEKEAEIEKAKYSSGVAGDVEDN